MGWYPEFNSNGAYKINLVKESDWNKAIIEFESRELKEIIEQLEIIMIQINECIINKYACPCCGYFTLDTKPPGTYEICDICLWEDDSVQYFDLDYEGGANATSLRNYQKLFANESSWIRKPNKYDLRNPEWKPFNS